MTLPELAVAGLSIRTILPEVAKQAQDFVVAILGKQGKTVGGAVGELIRERREHNRIIVAAHAYQPLIGLNLEPVNVPLRIAAPAFEAASMEDDPELQARWSNLLANAADPRQLSPVGPIFPYILRDLGPRDVKFLDALYNETTTRLEAQNLFNTRSLITFSLDDLKTLYGELGFAEGIKNFQRPSVEEQRRPSFHQQEQAFWLLLDIVRRDVIRETIIAADQPGFREASAMKKGPMKVYSFSDLGCAFVEACRPPKRNEAT